MSDKRKILLQLDTDPQPSVFDRVVAVDAGVDFLFTHHSVKPEQVQGLVHGAIFTRGPKDLHRTAVFIGGSDVAAGEAVLAEVKKALIPQYRLTVSVMLDSNGSNTTAAAAVRAASKHMDLGQARALILGGTGPVGLRVARLLARQGAHVRIGSRSADRAKEACEAIRARVPNARVEAIGTANSGDGPKALDGRDLVIAAGAAGAVLLPAKQRAAVKGLHVLIDLNAVPPAGIEGVEVTDKAVTRDGIICYGAIGVGDTKMKIHKSAVGMLFEQSNLVLDAEEVYDLALRL
jgi:methylenetetrahydrofolate/methylenetetrahydromethanopterin dehydrogenase (NADP+)